jgi:hypothetical protein
MSPARVHAGLSYTKQFLVVGNGYRMSIRAQRSRWVEIEIARARKGDEGHPILCLQSPHFWWSRHSIGSYGWQECAVLSKCANPECSEIFRYLHAGKIFYLAPTPDLRIAMRILRPALHERFWLCAHCSNEMTLIWDGTEVKVVRRLTKVVAPLPSPPVPKTGGGRRPRARAASAGREDK